MRHSLLLFAAAISLSACGPMLSAIGGLASVPESPSAIAENTVLDEKFAIAVESMYTATARAGALAFRTGIVTPSSDPAVQGDDFCPKVLARIYEPTDRGSSVMAAECKLRKARDTTRAAYAAGNAATYNEAGREAVSLSRELIALIRDN